MATAAQLADPAQRQPRAWRRHRTAEGGHRRVEGWFEQFKKSRLQAKKAELAESICDALRIHTQIEEEIFYPAFLEATRDEDIHHEAEVEHQGAKNLIAEIEQAGSDDEYFVARVNVLAEMIRQARLR